MSATKEAVAFSDPALGFARSLVEAGEYDDPDTAVSHVLDRVREDRAPEWKLFGGRVVRRLDPPSGRSITIESPACSGDRLKTKQGPGEGGK